MTVGRLHPCNLLCYRTATTVSVGVIKIVYSFRNTIRSSSHTYVSRSAAPQWFGKIGLKHNC